MKKEEYIRMLLADNETEKQPQKELNEAIIDCVDIALSQEPEDFEIEDTKIVDDAFKRLSVPAWVDYWGYDVNHDWPWWRKQIAYFLQFFVG